MAIYRQNAPFALITYKKKKKEMGSTGSFRRQDVSQEVLRSQARVPGLPALEAQQPAPWEDEELPQG